LFIFAILAGSVFVGFAQGAAAGRGEGSATVPGGPNQVDVSSFPYSAEITGDNVYIRSGPGTNFYHCGKLNAGDKIKVVGKQFSWSRIVPPVGSFSWISMQYVQIDPADSTAGIVTGDSVRVYAGSDYVKPLYSTTLQGKLNKGDKVKLLGQQMDDYYKIATPSFAYLWVSTNFTKPVPEVAKVPPTVKPPPEPNEPNETAPVPVVPTEVTPESQLERYRVLQKQVQAERSKPIEQQDYTSMKKALAAIASDKDAGRAARYAKYVLRRIESFELALAVAKEVRLQNEQLEKIRAGIDKARTARLAEVEDLGRFAAVGELQTYETYGPGHYRIVDKSGKMVCYALPSGQASQAGLRKLVGRKVGIAGTIEPHLPTKKALVRFSKIVELK
jgi:uncharacterized protein YgiM (DUF1202 family)